MKISVLSSVVIWVLCLCFSKSLLAITVGFQQFKLNDVEERPLSVTLWYPAYKLNTQTLGVDDLVADNIAFKGTKVIKNAKLVKQEYPLVILSHGYRGSWRNLNWLATQLVQNGFMVVAPDHPGTTTFDQSLLQASKWWLRPHDLKRVLDHLLQNPLWHTSINKNNITAIGHSLGGWSVMQLVGAEFNRADYLLQCERHPASRSCTIADELGLAIKQSEEPKKSQFVDHRIKKAVILDLGLARSFSISSLSKAKTPVLILGAGIDIGNLSQSMESGYLAEHLPLLNRHYKVYEQATHFSFMQLCKLGAIAILEEEEPGDGIICKDGIGTLREALHKQMFDNIYDFLEIQ